jgi:hypothetical protein
MQFKMICPHCLTSIPCELPSGSKLSDLFVDQKSAISLHRQSCHSDAWDATATTPMTQEEADKEADRVLDAYIASL